MSENHVGIWGTQFDMRIQYLREEYPDVVHDDSTALKNITYGTVFHKRATIVIQILKINRNSIVVTGHEDRI
jgi:hypothetical protein